MTTSLKDSVTVAYLNLKSSEGALYETERQITDALIAKGTILAKNNSESLKGMAEDNAFGAVQALVSSTVTDDKDIIYGTYLDEDLMPWVYATEKNPKGSPASKEALDNKNNLWGSELDEPEHKLTQFAGEEIYLFVAPVIVDDEKIGSIHYGLSTQSMRNALSSAKKASKTNLITTMGALIGLAIIVILMSFAAIRSIAHKITAPLIDLTKAAETISKGDYNQAANVASNDEIGELANNFNQMRTTIQKKINDLGDINIIGENMTNANSGQELSTIICKASLAHANATIAIMKLTSSSDSSPTIIDGQDTYEGASVHNYLQSNQDIDQLIERIENSINVNNATIQLFDDSVRNMGIKVIALTISDGDKKTGQMIIIGDKEQFNHEKNDEEYYLSIGNLMSVNLNNIQMRLEIEEHNRNLEVKIKQRTAALQEKTNDILNMMENMHQGLFTITQDENVHPEYSKYLENIFNTSSIANKPYADLLFTHCNIGTNTKDQVTTSVSSLLGSDEMMFSFNSHLLLNEIDITDSNGVDKILQLDWDPIVSDDCIDKIMVTVRDVTQLKALEKEAQAQKQELELVGQVLNIEAEKFEEFITSSERMLDSNKAIIQNSNTGGSLDVDLLFRNMHTIKGNSRTYSLGFITDSVHDAETRYDQIRKGGDDDWKPEDLVSDITVVEEKIKQYKHINHDVLKRTQETTKKQISNEDERLLIESIATVKNEKLSSEAQKSINEINKIIYKLNSFKLKTIVEDKLESLKDIALQQEKEIPIIDINDEGVHLSNDIKEVLNGVFMHTLRNAIDHGIETCAERKTQNKPEAGRISITTTVHDGVLTIKVLDDGKGLNIKALAKKGINANMLTPDEENDHDKVANLIFAAGMSTAEEVTTISGRGVGMDAIKKYLVESGGDAAIVTHGINAHGNCIFHLEISLPSHLFKSFT